MTDWDRIWQRLGGSRGGQPDLTMVRFVSRTFGPWLAGRIFLDIGSGTGANSHWLEQRGADVVSIDPSHHCRAHYHFSVDQYVARMIYPDFNCVLDINTLCHNPDAELDYGAIRQMLKKGGWFYCVTPHLDHHNWEQNGLRNVGEGKAFTRYASEWDLRKMLRHFTSVSIREQLEPAGAHLYVKSWCVEAQK